jgi:hypothetical protein
VHWQVSFQALEIPKGLSLARTPTIPATVTSHPVRYSQSVISPLVRCSKVSPRDLRSNLNARYSVGVYRVQQQPKHDRVTAIVRRGCHERGTIPKSRAARPGKIIGRDHHVLHLWGTSHGGRSREKETGIYRPKRPWIYIGVSPEHVARFIGDRSRAARRHLAFQ